MSNLRDIDKFIYWDPKRNQYVPYYWRKEILPLWMGFAQADIQAPNGVVTIPAAGAGIAPRVGFKQDYASLEGLDQHLGTPFEVRSIVFEDSVDTTALAQFTVLLQDLGQKRDFMNNPVHIRTIAGTAQTPALLREPYWFMSQANISAQFAKIVGGATTARMFLVGAQYFPWSPEFMRKTQSYAHMKKLILKWLERRKYVQPYWLTTEQPIVLGAGGTGEFFLKIGDDGHFEGFSIAVVSDGDFEWELSEPKTQQTIMNGSATLTNSLGNANFPTLLPTAYLVPSGYRLRLRITDLSGAPNTIFFTINGRKLYVPMADIGPMLNDTAVPTPADTPSEIVPAPFA